MEGRSASTSFVVKLFNVVQDSSFSSILHFNGAGDVLVIKDVRGMVIHLLHSYNSLSGICIHLRDIWSNPHLQDFLDNTNTYFIFLLTIFFRRRSCRPRISSTTTIPALCASSIRWCSGNMPYRSRNMGAFDGLFSFFLVRLQEAAGGRQRGRILSSILSAGPRRPNPAHSQKTSSVERQE